MQQNNGVIMGTKLVLLYGGSLRSCCIFKKSLLIIMLITIMLITIQVQISVENRRVHTRISTASFFSSCQCLNWFLCRVLVISICYVTPENK